MEQPLNSQFGILAKSLLAGAGELSGARVFAEQTKAPDRVQRILKEAVGSMTLADPESASLADMRLLTSTFVETLRNGSVFFRLLDGGFRRAPSRTRIGIATAGATGWIVGEGAPVPLTRIALEHGAITQRMAAALLVTTDELARESSAAATNLIIGELRAAISSVVDETFIDEITTTATPSFASVGDPRSDTLTLLRAVDTGAMSRLFFIFGTEAAKHASVADLGHESTMTPAGGEWFGLPALVSDAIPDSTIMLIDANAFIADSRAITLRASREALVEMSNEPTSETVTPTAASELVSLWQTNGVGLLAQAYFGYEQVRDNAVAEITGVDWVESLPT